MNTSIYDYAFKFINNKINTMATNKLKRQTAFKDAIIEAFKKSQPQAISFFKGQLIKQ